jgi:hypothetical protein
MEPHMLNILRLTSKPIPTNTTTLWTSLLMRWESHREPKKINTQMYASNRQNSYTSVLKKKNLKKKPRATCNSIQSRSLTHTCMTDILRPRHKPFQYIKIKIKKKNDFADRKEIKFPLCPSTAPCRHICGIQTNPKHSRPCLQCFIPSGPWRWSWHSGKEQNSAHARNWISHA